MDTGWFLDGVESGRLERSIALAQEDGNGPGAGDGQVEFAVGIEIRRHQEARLLAAGVIFGGLKRAVTVAQQDRDGMRIGHRYRQVRLSIAIEVSHRELGRWIVG